MSTQSVEIYIGDYLWQPVNINSLNYIFHLQHKIHYTKPRVFITTIVLYFNILYGVNLVFKKQMTQLWDWTYYILSIRTQFLDPMIFAHSLNELCCIERVNLVPTTLSKPVMLNRGLWTMPSGMVLRTPERCVSLRTLKPMSYLHCETLHNPDIWYRNYWDLKWPSKVEAISQINCYNTISTFSPPID